MNKYQETFNTWNSVAQHYEDLFFNLDLYNDTYDAFLNLLPKPISKILDVGCGPGNITHYLFKKNPDLKIKGIDISENMIVLAKKNNAYAEFNIMDIRNLNTLQETFDGIICGFSMPYLSKTDSSKFISNCSRLLHKDGVLYLSFVEGDYKKSGFITGSTGDRAYFYYHNLEFLKSELKKHGFHDNRFFLKTFKRNDNSKENHSILLGKKA